MVEIIYRIYEVCEPKEPKSEYEWRDTSKRIIAQEVLICESRAKFKEIILDLYGGDIKFKSSAKYPIGQKYCIIISESCDNTESYTTLISCKCENCQADFKAINRHIYRIDNYTVDKFLGGDKKYKELAFCSRHCAEHYADDIKRKLLSETDLPEEFDGWISKENLSSNKAGFIYKITKRSTGEFYVGQSVYVPIWRWGQHLRTSRFPLSDINDYIFEVIETVDKIEDLSKREKFYIQKLYKENPELSLNISLTKGIETESDENQIALF